MKTKALTMVALFVLGSMALFAGNKTEKFTVKGNCGMCEKRIEKAASQVEGVISADWDKETKEIEVTFDDTKTNIHKIHMAVAKAGHDTDMHKADDKVYNELPGCCKYDRSDAKKDGEHKH